MLFSALYRSLREAVRHEFTLTLKGSVTYYEAVAEVAQLVEHSTENAGVAGSIPALGTSAASGSSSVVEHFLAKEDVAGSNPVSRSSNFIQ